MMCRATVWFVFFFNDTATTEIYTLSLHDALPILSYMLGFGAPIPMGWLNVALLVLATPVQFWAGRRFYRGAWGALRHGDRKSTRLNSSHANISYAVFCLKKKKKNVDFTHQSINSM